MRDSIRRLFRHRKAAVGGGILLFFLVLALVGPWLVMDPSDLVGRPHQPPSRDHLFGTTGQGQDVLAQTVAGARETLAVGFAVGLLVTLVGAIIGVTAGYLGRRVDDALSLTTNVFLVIPGLPLAIVLGAYLPSGPLRMVAVLTVAGWFIGGFSMLVWGFFVSTTLLYHGTFTINSLSHVFGKRRYKTTDTSKNNWLLALITLGEGWHNNHHFHQNTANQGWFWWEVDLSYYSLKALSWVGLVSDLRLPSEQTKYSYLKYSAEDRAALNPPSRWFAPLAAQRKAAEEKMKAAEGKVREALANAADSLPSSAPSPQALLKRQ